MIKTKIILSSRAKDKRCKYRKFFNKNREVDCYLLFMSSFFETYV
jgi:hypothetical protein